jgi:hypothetical protein
MSVAEFISFHPRVHDHGCTRGQATIVCSGFLLEKEDYVNPWLPYFIPLVNHRDIFALKYETAGQYHL